MDYRIVADESVDHRIIVSLREAGFSVYSIGENQPAIRDEEVLELAVVNNALLLTEDKDFGELVFRLQLKHKGILLIRLEEKEKTKEVVQAIVKYFPDLLNKFSVLNDNKLRVKD